MALTNTIKQVTVDATAYEILPESLSTEGTYLASCPALSSDTTIEVTSNKVTSLLSSSDTDNQYPSALAVYNTLKGLFGKYGTVD